MKEKIRLKSKSIKKLRKIDTAYNALFNLDCFKEKLVRSPVEINNNMYIKMWRDCFDRQGRFIRSKFNTYHHEFENWDSAFYLMWLDLKSIDFNQDRNAVLNCLARFVTDSDSINEYIDFILKDFFYYPLHLHYSDTNALVFANMLLFRNHADRYCDFERTPEDVIGSGTAKNKDLTKRLAKLISREWGDRLYEKVETIKKNLHLALAPKKEKTATLPADMLIKMLREVTLFLTLVGGMGGHKIVRNIVNEFGNPKSEIFHLKNSPGYIKNLLQFLQVAIRCLITIGDEKDIELLNNIKAREKRFLSLKGLLDADLSFHRKMVNKMMTVVDEGVAGLHASVTKRDLKAARSQT